MNRENRRGRGRNSAGKGRHVSPTWSRPRLPAKLAKELSEGNCEMITTKNLLSGRKERRKHERIAKKEAGACASGPSGPSRERSTQRCVDSKDQMGHRPAKRARKDAVAGKVHHNPGQDRKKGGNFSSLLPLGGGDSERALQQELARKLGLKKGKKDNNVGDGLDDLLEGFGSGEEELLALGSKPRPASSQSAKHQSHQRQGQAASSDYDSRDGSKEIEWEEDATSEEVEDEEDEEDGGTSNDEHSGSELEGILLGGSCSGSEMVGPDADGEGGAVTNEGVNWGVNSESESQDGLRPSRGKQKSSKLGTSDGDAPSSDSDEAWQCGAESRQMRLVTQHLEQASQGGSKTVQNQARKKEETGSKAGGKYVPPAVRRTLEVALGDGTEAARISRRVRGLLNRLAEANIQGITSELAALYESEGRRLVSDAVCAELLQAAAEGPRASDRFAAVTAAAVAGLAGSTHSAEIIANFLDRLATRLAGASSAGESLTCHNLAMVAASLYSCGALRPDLLYSLLNRLKSQFSEMDISLMAVLLRAGGLQLRGDDPVAMKDFVVSVHARAAQAGGLAALSKRGQSMLELVVDIKNNRKREGGGKGASSVLSPAITKWLKSVGVSEVALGGITWDKVLTKNKKGIWWMPAAADAVPQEPAARTALRAATAAAVDREGGFGGPELLKLAASLRMNTDVRRAVFCIVMGSEDCMDAFEKLLRLPLKGEQQREVVRVAVECCLQERAWNPYYALLLLKLCEASKSHRMTLQFCMWDQLKEVEEGELEVRRMTNLARLMGDVVVGGALSSTTLKVVEFSQGMSAREVLFWRVFFQHILAACKSRQQVTALFQKIAAQSQLKQFCAGLAVFLRRVFGPWLAAKQPGDSSGLSDAQLAALLSKLQAAERALGTSMP